MEKHFQICGHPSWMDQLREDLVADAFTDMSISLMEKETKYKYSIRCHRLVLYSSGGIFSTILKDSDVETNVNVILCDATRDDLNNLIDFVYTGIVDFEEKSDAEKFLPFVQRLGLETPEHQDITPTLPLLHQQQHHEEDKHQEQEQEQQQQNHDQVQHNHDQEQQELEPKIVNEWNSSSNPFPSIMTDLLGDVSETLPDLSLDSISGDVLSSAERNELPKTFDWSWKEEQYWQTNNSPTSRHESLSTVDSSEIMYDFGYLENVKNSIECSNDSFQDLSTNLSTSSPSNFSSEEEDVEMKSLIAFCSLQELESSMPATVINSLEKVSKSNRIKKSNRFQCSVCEKTFLSQHYLRFHESSVHQKEKSFSCLLCSKSFSGDYYLKQHIRRMHSEDRPHVCSACQTSFSVRYDLVVHMRTHDSVKAFQCQTCSRTYSTQRALKEHERTHTGERPYQCSVCCKRFALPKTLRVHFRQHSGERPYLCPKCGCTFVQNSTLRNHLKTNHGIDRAKSKE